VIRRDGTRMLVSGPVTLANVGEVLEAGSRLLGEGATTIDLGEVTELDSALLAAVLCWMREARAAKRELTLERSPAGMASLATLYGVDTMLSGAQADR